MIISLDAKKPLTTTALKKKAFNWGYYSYSFRGLFYYHHDQKHGNIQADMVLEW